MSYIGKPTLTSTAITPTGDVSATDLQGAIAELASEKATLNSPALSGIPTAPTATIGTNTTQLATTAFVLANNKTEVFRASYTLADGVGGGNTTPGGQLYPFNTIEENTIAGASMTSSAITLPAGKYLVYANVFTDGAMDQTGGILSLNDGTSDILWGVRSDSGQTYGMWANLTIQSFLNIATAKTLTLKGWWLTQTGGLGAASTSYPGFEKYGEIMLLKVG